MRKMLFWVITLSTICLIWGISGADSYQFKKPIDTTQNEKKMSGAITIDNSTGLKLSQETENTIAANSAAPLNQKIGILDKSTIVNSDNEIPRIWISSDARNVLRDASAPRDNGYSTSPRGRMILQGGDNFGTATVIPGLPYSDTGTTAGYVHDYDLSCASSTAPDIVYQYIPVADETVNVSLMRSGFDTILGIFEDSLSNEIGCNDQFSYTSQSYIGPLNLQAGHTYFIVIGGYGENEGNYTIEMFNPPIPPANDNCADITPQPLIANTPLVFTGDLSGYGATDDCPALSY
jgi:hypothetical protein